MKIAQFILSLGTGGAEAIVKDYAIELKRRGHEVEVITLLPLANTVNEQILRDNGVPFVSVYEEIYSFQSDKFWVRAIRKPRRDKLVSAWIAKYVEQNKPDVIHMHLTVEQFFAPISDKLGGVRLVYTCHNETSHYFGEGHKRETENVRSLIKNNNMQLIALHDRMAKELDEIFGIKNTLVLNNPIDVERFACALDCRDVKRKALNIPEGAFVVGHVGRFTYQKNHELLVKIFAEVARERQNAFLLMVGDGELRGEVEAQLASLGLSDKYMILSGRKDIPELLAAMDVFVFPSRFEGFGIAFLEAQATKLKCVGADTLPHSVLVSSNATLINILDSTDKWAAAVLADVNERKCADGIMQFDIKAVVDKLAEVYKQETYDKK